MIGQMRLAAGKSAHPLRNACPIYAISCFSRRSMMGPARSRVSNRDSRGPSQSRRWAQTTRVPLLRDWSFSNGAHMQPLAFRYRLSDRGRIVLGPLSSEQTLEFEELSRRDREGLIDLLSELRLLELYVKYNGSGAQAPLAPSEPAFRV